MIFVVNEELFWNVNEKINPKMEKKPFSAEKKTRVAENDQMAHFSWQKRKRKEISVGF